MLSKDNSKTTIGFYLRGIRALLNYAKEKGYSIPNPYPFGKGRYVIPKGVNIKKALDKDDIDKIKRYTPQSRNEEMHRDYWLLSYYCNGINVKDIARLKFGNIQNTSIIINRAKTEYTSRANSKPIVINSLPEIKKIIQKWGNTQTLPSNYVFPILNAQLSEIEKEKKIAQTIQNINKNMKRIADQLQLNKLVTTYVARHSFATILKRGGVPIAYISESLGHSNIAVTENYLGSFDDESRKKFAKLL